MRLLLPDGWPRPRGYANGIAARGTLVFVAGQIGWDTDGRLREGFVAQTRQALENVVAVLAAGGARPEHVTRMTWYVADAAQYRAETRAIGAVYRELFGTHYPTMSAVGAALMEPGALVEIEVTAVVPD